MKTFKSPWIAVFLLCSFLLPNCISYADTETDFDRGLGMYQKENNDEALAFFTKAQQTEPSTRVSYYLGLTYKRLQRYDKAKDELRAAIDGNPKIKEALIELIEVYYQLNELDNAKATIRIAEEQQLRPAPVAFIKGLVLQKAGDTGAALDSFENAKHLDPALTESVNYQIGLISMRNKQFEKAQKLFQEIITLDPNSDISSYASEYVKVLENISGGTKKPFRLNASVFSEYDDNVILQPGNVTASSDTSNEEDWREVVTLNAVYTQRITDKLSLDYEYDLYYANQHKLNDFDLHGHTVGITPTYAMKTIIFSMPLQYNYRWVDGKDFLGTASATPLVNFQIGENQIGQLSTRIQQKSFIRGADTPDENRDALNVAPGAAWYLFFWQGKGFLGLRYEFDKDNTDGQNWDYQGHRVNATAQIPLAQTPFKFTQGVDFYYQGFENTHSFFATKREDRTFTLSSILSYEIQKQFEVQLKYTYVNDDSNIAIYQYDRSVASVGLVYKY